MCGISDVLTRHEHACAFSRAFLNADGSLLYRADGRYIITDKATLEALRIECKDSIEAAKGTYLEKLAGSLNDPDTTPKNYWKIIYRVMNKTRAPKIPPILDSGTFVINCKDKAKLFNDFFSKQCTLIINDSILPDFQFITEARIDTVVIKREDILALIRNLNPNKATGSDEISGQIYGFVMKPWYYP